MDEDLQLIHTVMDPILVMEKPLHLHVISTTLTRETGNLIPDLKDELAQSLDEIWGKDTSTYKEVVVWNVMQHIIARVTNRILIGLPMCRDVTLLKASMTFAQDIPITSTLLRFIWEPLRPLVAPLITLPTRIHDNRFYQILKPEVERRLRAYDAKHADPEAKATNSEPRDFLQWLIIQAKDLGDPYMWKPYTLAARVMLTNFASIHTSSFAITHVLLDLASSKQEYIDELRGEIREVLAAHDGQWNKRSLSALSKLDSTMRESQRLNSFAALATLRTVIATNGVKAPSGIHLPRGTRVAVHSYPVFHDADIYPDPYTFKPFRFAEKRQAAGEGTYVEKARQAWATTNPQYTAFGHGRHACPGRFFASSEIKLMLAYIIMNYDFEPQKKRPENLW